MTEIPLEASPEDVTDQRTEVVPARVDDEVAPASAVPFDVDPADFSDQQAEVPLGDDDWV